MDNDPTSLELKKYGYEKIHHEIDGASLLDEGGDIPIYLDKIMTDEDFKKIRFL